MGSTTLDVDLKPDECFERIQRIIGDFDFEVKGAVPNQIVNAEGGCKRLPKSVVI